MMNKENKVMNAIVNVMVCPKRPGEACCSKCGYVGVENCYESLMSDSMHVLNMHFCAKAPDKASVFADTSNEVRVVSILREIGIPAHILGYGYTRWAIMLCIKNAEYVNQITNVLYPAVAQEFNTSASRVERAIRHAIECAWNRGDIDVLEKYFGNTIDRNKGKPTNSEFIATIVEHMKFCNLTDRLK